MNRLLGVKEHLLWLTAQTKPMNVVLCASLTNSLSVNQLTEALTWVQRCHPLLGVRIVIDEQEQPRFVSEGVPAIPLRVRERQGEEHWCQEVEAELLRPFPWSQGPLLRVVLLRSPDCSEIIVTFDHCIGDGLSGAYLLRDILHEISEPSRQRQFWPELPPLDELIPPVASRLSVNSIASDSDSQMLLESSSELSQNRASLEKELFDHWSIRLLHWCLSPSDTNALVARCRQEQTTVQGALCASFLLTLAAETSSPDKAVVKYLVPINIRRYTVPPISENFGVYQTTTRLEYQVINSPAILGASPRNQIPAQQCGYR